MYNARKVFAFAVVLITLNIAAWAYVWRQSDRRLDEIERWQKATAKSVYDHEVRLLMVNHDLGRTTRKADAAKGLADLAVRHITEEAKANIQAYVAKYGKGD